MSLVENLPTNMCLQSSSLFTMLAIKGPLLVAFQKQNMNKFDVVLNIVQLYSFNPEILF